MVFGAVEAVKAVNAVLAYFQRIIAVMRGKSFVFGAALGFGAFTAF